MSNENQKPKAPTDLSRLVNAGGKKLLHHVPEKTEKEISFDHLGGERVGHFQHDAPTESVEKEDEGGE